MTRCKGQGVVWGLTLLAALEAVQAGAADAVPARHGPGEACLGGLGGVYLLAEPGELTIEVLKRDRNRRGSTAELRAILVGPERRVIQEATIPDDGQARGSGWGPVQQTRLSARVPRKGLYVLNITVSQDRYGEEIAWGFATNCPRYLIETARGHKDERHQEPIVLWGSEQPADVCFLPRKGPLNIEVSGLPASATKLDLFDANGTLLREIAVAGDGTAACSVPASMARDRAPWRLHLPTRQATIQIDGVTRWDGDDAWPDLCCWTTEPESFFPLLDYRWLLTPYSRIVYAPAGERAEAVFRVHNNSGRKQTIQLAIEFPGESWPVELAASQVTLGGKRAAEVTVRGAVAADGKPRICHLRGTPAETPELTTYATLEIRGGEAPASQPLALPLTLKAYRHENEQFGHVADFPVDSQVYFDPQNRPFICAEGGVAALRNGRWTVTDLRHNVHSAGGASERDSYRLYGSKVAFDRDGGVYVLALTGRQAALLHSTDGGRTFNACPIPGREGRSGSYDFEQFSGHNGVSGSGTQAENGTGTDRPDRSQSQAENGTGTDRPDRSQSRAENGTGTDRPDRSQSRAENGTGTDRPDRSQSRFPPPIVRNSLTGSDPKLFWRRLHDVELFAPKFDGGRLVVGEPILVSRKGIGLASHSGIPSSLVSRGDKVHLVWAEATEPTEKVPGVPTYVVTYDRATGKLGAPALVGYGAPPNDIHNSPSITMDSQGYLHVLAGTHGRPFQYARSLKPNDSAGGWTPAEPVGADLSQTYIGFVCGPDDTLHLAYRLWHRGEQPYPKSHYATLSYSRKRPGQPWEAPRDLIVPPFSEYSVYYHRLTIDRQGRLFLSYDYWSTLWFYRNDQPGRRRTVMMSPDGGQTWRLATSRDLAGDR